MANVEQNKDLVRLVHEEGFAGNEEVARKIMAPDFIDHPPQEMPGVPTTGPESMLAQAPIFKKGFSDYRDEMSDVVAEGDIVVSRGTFFATHDGLFMGMPPTMRKVAFDGLNWFRAADGVLVERWGQIDGQEMMRQLGMIPGGVWQLPPPPDFPASQESDLTRTEDNKALVRRLYEDVYTAGNADAAGEVVHDLFYDHIPPRPGLPLGPTGVRQAVLEFKGLLDGRISIDDIIAEGDRVAVRFTLQGQHNGELPPGYKATGKPINVTGQAILRVVEGKVVQRWQILNQARLLQQIGFMPGRG
jgi:predicted ester cyclase